MAGHCGGVTAPKLDTGRRRLSSNGVQGNETDFQRNAGRQVSQIATQGPQQLVRRVSLACGFNPTFSTSPGVWRGKIELVSVLDFPEDLLPDLDREMAPDDGDPVVEINFRRGPGVPEVALERSQLSAGMVPHVKNESRGGVLDGLVDSIQVIQNVRVILAHKKTLCQIGIPRTPRAIVRPFPQPGGRGARHFLI